MKKITLTLVAVMCALCCVLGLAACGDDDNADGGKVTAEKWSAGFTAFATADNYSVEMGNNLLEFDGTKFHAKIGENEVIVAKDGNNYYQYLKEGANGAWTKESMTEQDFTNGINLHKTSVLSLVGLLKDDYDSFTFKDGKYSASLIDKTADVGGELRDVVVVFKNNKLSSITFKADLDEPNGTYTLKNVGSTSVKLPAVNETATNEVTAEQWTAAFNVTSYTYTFTNDQTTDTYEFDGNKFHFDSTEHQIISVEGDKGYVYTEMKDNGVSNGWMRTDIGLEDATLMIETYKSLLLCVKDSFSDFTYADGKYVASQISIEAMWMNIVSAEITFENKKLTSVKLISAENETCTIEQFDTTTITLPTEYTDSEDEPSAEVTADQWMQIFESIGNFTVETFTDDDKAYETAKFDGSTLLFCNHDGVMIIYTKDGNNYERYQTFTDEISWIKGYEEASEYDEFIEFAQIINIFKGNYTLFTYDDGVYTLEQQIKDFAIIRATYNKFTNVRITFENGALIGMEFEATRTSNNTTIKVVISDIGSTAITIPADYTENN